MNIHIPYWLASAIFGLVFCSFLYAVIRRIAMWIFDIIERNDEIGEEERRRKMVEDAKKEIREKFANKGA